MKIPNLGWIKWERHTLPILPSVDSQDMTHWNHNFSRNSAKPGLKANPVVLYRKLMTRLQREIKNNLIVFDELHWDFYPCINKNSYEGRKTKIRAPLM